MKQTIIILLYKTDVHHSYASRDIIAVIAQSHENTAINMAIALCKEQAKKEGEDISEDQIFNLKNIKQTQGYSGDGEFDFEIIEANILL